MSDYHTREGLQAPYHYLSTYSCRERGVEGEEKEYRIMVVRARRRLHPSRAGARPAAGRLVMLGPVLHPQHVFLTCLLGQALCWGGLSKY